MQAVPNLIPQLKQAAERAGPDDLQTLIAMLTFLPQFAYAAGPVNITQQPPISFTSNEEIWDAYHGQRLRDTVRVRLEHFHLFEWFPLSPGRYHTDEGRHFRQDAASQLERGDDDDLYYNPYGKVNMVKGGVGAVKLGTRMLTNIRGQQEPYALMTASASGTCHEGVPVLVPRRLYAGLTARLIDEGAVPVVLTGEMCPLPDDARSFFDEFRLSSLPNLIIHADDIEVLAHSRPEVTRYTIAMTLTFFGEFRQREDVFVTYCSFDPATQASQERSVAWLTRYVQDYAGQVIIDFDEQFPQFRDAPFALRRVMAGQLDPEAIHESLHQVGYYYAFPDQEGFMRQAASQHNHYVNVIGPRGVLVQGGVGGSVITGDNNDITGTEQS